MKIPNGKMKRNQGLENSLRCLQHPLSLLSIALLLLNDHVFKIISPSWLTGKLSDFAGLFFFPFIVTAVLSILLARFNLKLNIIGNISFGLLALWFLLFKTIPAINEVFVILVSNLLGRPIQLLLDSTDELALVVLYPSWKLWGQTWTRKYVKFGYAPLLLGVLASIATSPPAPQVEVVTHLKAVNDRIFAIDSTNWMVAVSEDAGTTWKWTDEIEPDFFPIEPVPLPVAICDQNKQDVCYRINGQGIVEYSNNSGASWVTSWELPNARLSFIERIDSDINLGPYDLLTIRWQDHEYILVAMGEDGVLRKELPDGEWERIQVQNATPTLYKSANISDAISIVWAELLFWFFVSILSFIVACWVIWSSNSKVSSQHLSKLQWVYLPALSPVISIIATLTIQALIYSIFYIAFQLPISIDNFEEILLIVLVISLVTALLTLPAIIYLRLKKLTRILIKHNYSTEIASKLVWESYLTHIFVFLFGSINFIFWALGVITRYETTWIWAVISSGIIATILIRNIEKLSKHTHPVDAIN